MGTDYISFPNLNLKFSVSPVIVQFGNFTLKWYGLLIAIGFLLAVLYALKRAKDFDIDPDRLIDVTLVSTLFAFIGARLYFVIFSSDASYLKDPLSILYVWKGGLAIYGGIIFGFATAIWMCRVRKVNVLAAFDIASLGFLIGQGIGRWGNFFNQEAFGANTSDTYLLGMTGSIIKTGATATSSFNTSGLVHPTFLYESFWCLLGLLVLHLISKKAYKFKGEIFSLYIMWYGLGRFFIEGLRTDSLYFGAIRISQLVAILSIIAGLVLFFILRAHQNQLPKDLFAQEDAEGETVSASLKAESDGEESRKDEEKAAVTSADSVHSESEVGETKETEKVKAEEAESDQTKPQA